MVNPTESLGNNVELEMVNVPAGQFWMGSPENDSEGLDKERPQHLVTVPEFWMGKYPVTQAQYKEVMGTNPSYFKGANRPVEWVSWHDAVEFCEKISEQTGTVFRLPSEAEWEYACRAGTTTRFYFGDRIGISKAHCGKRKGVVKEEFIGVGRKEVDIGTESVGSYPSNAFGLYDMHGNVYEWCADHWHSNYHGAPTDGSSWLEGGNASYRVCRGGSWLNRPKSCRSAYRIRSGAQGPHLNIGFRVCCTASLKQATAPRNL